MNVVLQKIIENIEIEREQLEAVITEYIDLVNNNLLDDNKAYFPKFVNCSFPCDLRKIEFLDRIIFEDCNFKNALLDRAAFFILIEAGIKDFKGVIADNEKLSSLILEKCGIVARIPLNFSGTDISNSSFVNADLQYMQLEEANATNVNFTNACLKNSSFVSTDITGTNFKGAIFDPQALAKARNYELAIFSNPEKTIEELRKISLTLQEENNDKNTKNELNILASLKKLFFGTSNDKYEQISDLEENNATQIYSETAKNKKSKKITEIMKQISIHEKFTSNMITPTEQPNETKFISKIRTVKSPVTINNAKQKIEQIHTNNKEHEK